MSGHWKVLLLLLGSILLISRGLPTDGQSGGLCGTSNPKGLDRGRVAGRQAKMGQFPWVMALIANGEYFGGGSLIAPGLVLTAGHLLIGKTETDILVRAGALELTSRLPTSLAEERQVHRIMVHEAFEYTTGANNLALLFLNSPFVLKSHIQTICLPRPGKTFHHRRCKVAGWERRSFHSANHSNFLKAVDLPMVNRALCQDQLRNTALGASYHLPASLICAGGEEGQDACTGNGGSALFCALDQYPDRYEQAGIVNWGIECGSKNVPATYTNVAMFREWIDPHLMVVVSVPGDFHFEK